MKTLREIFKRSETKSENQHSNSCCGGNEHSYNQESKSQSNAIYQCPMYCEGDKTYNDPGVCPVCNMHLAPIAQ